MGRADRSADVWARTYPGAFRLAFWTIRNVVRLCRIRIRTRVVRRLHPSRAARGAAPSIILFGDSSRRIALDRLRFRRRAAYVLSVYGGMELGEVADALDCSPGGVSALLSA